MKIPPWKVEWVPVGDDLDDLAIHRDGIVADSADVGIECPEHRIVLEEVRSLQKH